MLVQAAWSAIRVRGRLQARYNRLVRRFGGDKNPAAKKKAITAIAHTLLKIAYQVLKSGTPYQELGADFYTRRESPEHKQACSNASCESSIPAAPSPSPSARRRPH
jgi:transposase